MKKKIITLSGWVIALCAITYNIINNYSSKEVIVNSTNKNNSDTLSMMYETEAGSGEYIVSNNSSFPTEGYTFNSRLSKCENGGTLSWDSTTNQVIMTGDKSDKCYVYFDIYTINFAEYIKGLYTTDGANNLYYHDGAGTYTNADLEAGDNSYRYAGSNDTTNNYVCFGSTASTCPVENLYRIIGVFDDDGDETYNVKLISANFATSTMLGGSSVSSDYNGVGTFDSTYTYRGTTSGFDRYYWNYENQTAAYNATNYYNVWSYSSLNTKHLNDYYLNTYLSITWSNKIATTIYKVGGNTWPNMNSKSNAKSAYSYEIVSPSTEVASTYNAKVGLMYLSDYYYAASPTYWSYSGYNSDATLDYRAAIDSNWLYLAGDYEWTLTRISTTSDNAFFVYTPGGVSSYPVNSHAYAIRPTFYLNSDVLITEGNGSISNPFRIVAR